MSREALSHLNNQTLIVDASAPTFEDVQRVVIVLISGKILVGYCLWQFLSVSHALFCTQHSPLFLDAPCTLPRFCISHTARLTLAT